MSQNHLVYSTDSGRISESQPEAKKSVSKDGIVRLRRETKGRKGKGVVTIEGLNMTPEQTKGLCSELKKACGTGGAVKQGVVEIQGDNREKIKLILEKKGMSVKLAGG